MLDSTPMTLTLTRSYGMYCRVGGRLLTPFLMRIGDHARFAMGTLCVIDQKPRQLTFEQREALRALAREVERMLELRRLRHSAERVHTAQVETTRLTRYVLHDLNNPLMVLLAHLDDLVDHLGGSAWVASVHEAQRAAGQIQLLTLNLSAIAPDAQGALTPHWATVEPAALIEETLCSLQILANRAGITLHGDLQHTPSISTDPILLRRVLENLLSNALGVSPRGGRVEIALAPTASGVELRVGDEGPGIPESLRELVFEPDLQAIRSKPRSPSSFGLGLAFCRVSLDALQGRIECRPRTPKGTEFRVTLPLRPAEPHRKRPGTSIPTL